MKNKPYITIAWTVRILFVIACIASYIYFFYQKDLNKELKRFQTSTDKVFFIYSGLKPLMTNKSMNISQVRQISIKNALYSSEPSINQELTNAIKHGSIRQKTIYEVTGKSVKDFISTIKLIPPRIGHIKACACLGNPKVLFFSKGKLLTFFSIHHGKSIRWKYHKKGDIDIEPVSQKKLEDFFIKHNLSIKK